MQPTDTHRSDQDHVTRPQQAQRPQLSDQRRFNVRSSAKLAPVQDFDSFLGSLGFRVQAVPTQLVRVEDILAGLG